MKLYHLVTPDQWEQFKEATFYAPPSLAQEGFIHCSSAEQVSASANRHFAGWPSLLLLVINPEKVSARIVFEDLYGGGEFPHIYGALPIQAIEAVIPLKPEADGRFSFLPPKAFESEGKNRGER
jgi:uncharacterized protein (DUF952 family)